MNAEERSRLIDALIEGEISEADFLRLEAEFHVDADARAAYYEKLELGALLEAEAKERLGGETGAFGVVPDRGEGGASGASRRKAGLPRAASTRLWQAATALAALVALALFVSSRIEPDKEGGFTKGRPVEPAASGFAVLSGQVDARWQGTTTYAPGDLLPAGPQELVAGVAQLDLFSGVAVVLEGPAEFELVTPMEMVVTRGKLRAQVPPAAEGFRVRTRDGEVVDLGTEFALEVTDQASEVHVLDGEIEWHGDDSREVEHMQEGQGLRWMAGAGRVEPAGSGAGFVGRDALKQRIDDGREARRRDWLDSVEQRRRDGRLIAYYPMVAGDEATGWSRRVRNEASGEEAHRLDGAVVAASRVEDRFGFAGSALDFGPAGSRVRIQVPGTHGSLTLMCWARIDSLDRWYNSLLLTDGHELHEPHWQIMDDGRLFFSVKAYEEKGKPDKHVYYSPSFWDPSLSGKWLMIATVYDIEGREVRHYLNGEAISRETIDEHWLVEEVRIGAASIGNWSEPKRDDPHFAVRNLNGCIDEFAIYGVALDAEEIAVLYEAGRP